MGISKSTFRLLLEEKKQNRLKGNILQLGRQFIFLSYKNLCKYAKKDKAKLNPIDEIKLSFDDNLKRHNYIDDVTFFKSLGFNKVDSIDISNYENPSIIGDLNLSLDSSLHNKFNVIFDGGSIEHVFNVPKALENVHNLLNDNGIIIHSSPSHNHVDHGFYMFSPTFFYEYYKANNYKILSSYIIEYNHNIEHSKWSVYNYAPGMLDHLSFGGFGKELLSIWIVAQKQNNSSSNKIPQQQVYHSVWANEKKKRRFYKMKDFIKKFTFVYLLLRRLKLLLKKNLPKRFKLPKMIKKI